MRKTFLLLLSAMLWVSCGSTDYLSPELRAKGRSKNNYSLIVVHQSQLKG